MGSLCSNENNNLKYELANSATFEVDKQNDLLDDLVHQRYKAACKIQSRFRGYIIKKKLNPFLILIKQKRNK